MVREPEMDPIIINASDQVPQGRNLLEMSYLYSKILAMPQLSPGENGERDRRKMVNSLRSNQAH